MTELRPEGGASPQLAVEALGGLGEMGRHELILDLGPDSFVIDAGALFAGCEDPGVERILAPTGPVVERWRQGRLRGLLLTHSHLDHIGGVGNLLQELPELPVYGSAFTLDTLRRDLERNGGQGRGRLQQVVRGEPLLLGQTEVRWIRQYHSVPDASAIALRGTATVVHSGDFRWHDDPLLGEPPDEAALLALGEGGVDLALVDSTNAGRSGVTRGERAVADELLRQALEAPGRLVVTLFSSHVERLSALVRAARRSGRRLALYGRSLEATAALARRHGLLDTAEGELLPIDHIAAHPRDQLIVAATGSQAEWRAVRARLGRREDPRLTLEAGDRVLWSARAIPGSERDIAQLVGRLVDQGASVVPPWAEEGAALHCSGHGHREEVLRWIAALHPRWVLPVHGEPWHLQAHAEMLEREGCASQGVLQLRSGERLVWEGSQVHRAQVAQGLARQVMTRGSWAEGERALSHRRRMASSGVGTATLVGWGEGAVCVVQTAGVFPEAERCAAEAAREDELGRSFAARVAGGESREDVEEELRRALARKLRRVVGAKVLCRARLVSAPGR